MLNGIGECFFTSFEISEIMSLGYLGRAISLEEIWNTLQNRSGATESHFFTS